MEALSYCGWFDEIPFTETTGDIRIEIFHKVLPLGSHSWHKLGQRNGLDPSREF